MEHISANLAFGRREKHIWGYKKLHGKKWRPFLFLFFGDSNNFVGAAKKSAGGHQMVTLRHCPRAEFLFG